MQTISKFTPSRQSLSHKTVGRLMIAVHTDVPPLDVEWEDYLITTANLTNKNLVDGLLVWTDGGSPTALQRTKIHSVASVKTLPTAIVSGSTMVRGVVKAISWFGKEINSFSPRNIEKAFEYLKLSVSQWNEIERQVALLRLALVPGAELTKVEQQVLNYSDDEIDKVLHESLEDLRAKNGVKDSVSNYS